MKIPNLGIFYMSIKDETTLFYYTYFTIIYHFLNSLLDLSVSNTVIQIFIISLLERCNILQYGLLISLCPLQPIFKPEIIVS
jgi:hypothetical protein